MKHRTLFRSSRAATTWTRPLGAGWALPAAVGNKAARLDRASARGLPVPQGYMVLHEGWQHVLDTDLIVLDHSRVQAPDAQRLLSALSLPSWHGSLAVRSAFASEDSAVESQAGFYTTRLWVEAQDQDQLASALCEVWSSGRPDILRRDVLVMQMVDAEVAGVAFSEQDYEDDLVNYTAGTAQRLVSGEIAGDSLQVPKWPTAYSRAATPPAQPLMTRLVFTPS